MSVTGTCLLRWPLHPSLPTRRPIASTFCIPLTSPHLPFLMNRYISSQTGRNVRMVGLSTALANAQDLADWLGIGKVSNVMLCLQDDK